MHEAQTNDIVSVGPFTDLPTKFMAKASTGGADLLHRSPTYFWSEASPTYPRYGSPSITKLDHLGTINDKVEMCP